MDWTEFEFRQVSFKNHLQDIYREKNKWTGTGVLVVARAYCLLTSGQILVLVPLHLLSVKGSLNNNVRIA